MTIPPDESLQATCPSDPDTEDAIREGLPAEQVSEPSGIESVSRLPGATVDLGRADRCGFGEVIYGEGKSSEMITDIIQAQLDHGQSALVTRIDSQEAWKVRQAFEYSSYNSVARVLRVANAEVHPPRPPRENEPHAAVVTAGSTDAGVAEEAIETLAWMGVATRHFDDIGVAGPQRLLAAVPQLREAAALVVVAGMEGALPSVMGGHVAAPVFAVPTSVGYGANLGGITALLGMLTSCAAGVSVVNIDAGFKGGYMAGMVVSQLVRANHQAVAPSLAQ